MLDFVKISTRVGKHDAIEVYPKFTVMKSKDLMIRGKKFYAVWNEEKGLWCTDEDEVLSIIDGEVDRYALEHRNDYPDGKIRPMHIRDAETRLIKTWHTYCQDDMCDNFHNLDSNLTFQNTEVKKSDYISKKLPYSLEEGNIDAYDQLMSVLYSDEERAKIEWAIGAVISGDSKTIQKFIVLYGAAGTGKSTVLNIIQALFEGYYEAFDSKALGSSSNQFALEPFKENPLVAIDHDGELNHIDDNTRLNKIVSHDKMTVNEKFRPTYSNRFVSFVFIGSNNPVRITDAKSGIIRRLIDVSPTGKTLRFKEYEKLYKNIKFELGAIAWHCLQVYNENPTRYNTYIPINMLGATNDFYNFVQDSYTYFAEADNVTLRQAWECYKTYCEDARVPYPMSQRAFKEELKNYFEDYKERVATDDGGRIRSYYIGFKKDKFEKAQEMPAEGIDNTWLEFKKQPSIFDKLCANWKAQYANEEGNPRYKWDNVFTILKNLDTSKLHFVLFPEEHLNHIVIDFDIPDETGQKSFEKNLKAASEWPETYAELSKSGKGIHLHYIYNGDPTDLDSIFDEHIEIKVFTGKSSLRRMLTRCNNKPIATISSNLPLKQNKPKGADMISMKVAKDEDDLRRRIQKNLNKGYHKYTKPSVDYIAKLLEDAYNSGMSYDVSNMRGAVFNFASKSTHNADYCKKLVMNMKFCSKNFEVMEIPQRKGTLVNEDDIVFFDVEVFQNLFVVCWMKRHTNNVVTMINPTPEDVENLMKFPLVGFNCRRYDNHILYARLMGYNNEQLYKLSQRIIGKENNAFFSNAYDVSYTDIYDFSSKKQSLKKFEVDLGIFHMELGIPWDQPVPEDKWNLVAKYCGNDVIATEKVFEARAEDWLARQILADIAGLSVNDTTNTLTTKIIFGNNRNPQNEFNYRFLGDESDVVDYKFDGSDLYNRFGDEYTKFDSKGRPVFPGYKYYYDNSIKKFVSLYRGEDVGVGGYVYANPGMYSNVALLDIASMHPSSVIAEKLFGERYTKRFEELKEARVAIKHRDAEAAGKLLGGALKRWLVNATEEVFTGLAQALKIAINSVYGLTSAGFVNPFRDPRNKDNIVAKRGALFMVNLKHVVEEQGFVVAHIKTDSIKIVDATPDIIQFVMDYGKQYGYTFEHEATYEKMCLVNDAVYIAKYSDDVKINGEKHAGKWTATGTQFAVPYVFKRLFSKGQYDNDLKPCNGLVFSDFCEVKSVSDADIYLDMNEGLPEDEHNYVFVGRVGLFCPIKPGYGGGEMLRYGLEKRKKEYKYSAVVGTKGYRWLEAPVVYTLDKRDAIDESYYISQVEDAIEAIGKYGDVDWFIDGHYNKDDYPPWQMPCGREDVDSCDDCKKCDYCEEQGCQNRRKKDD